MRVSVVAHFDTGMEWDKNFLLMLDVLLRVTDRIILVTTASSMPALPADVAERILLIRRPNVGYDFYSYKVGVDSALSGSELVDGILILNSSICLLDDEVFQNSLQCLISNQTEYAVRGITQSDQISWHLQSYALYFDLNELDGSWIRRFFNCVEPVNDKFEIVVRYEIGLSKALREEGVSTVALFKATFLDKCKAAVAILKSEIRRNGWYRLFRGSTWRATKEVNWTHFGAESLAYKFGFAKTEVLRTNPHEIDLEKVLNACRKDLKKSVESLIGRTQALYSSASSGLTVLKHSSDPMGIIREIIVSPRYAVRNAKIAVIVHLYYRDLLQEILDDVTNILEPTDLFITTPFEADLPYIFNEVANRQRHVTVLLTENRGRDVGPFISFFRTGRLDRYNAVLKLHSKKSKYSDKGDYWRRELYGPLCGSSINVLKALELIRKKNVGIVGPSKYFLSNPNFWGANRERLMVILNSCRINISSTSPELAFFAGTMFWFSPKALSAIHFCDGPSVCFEPENGKQDGTLAHAWERAFCLLSRASGYSVSSVDVEGVDLFFMKTDQNRVPVLETDC